MNYILNILESNYITEVFIGVTGIVVAIVIFIAEVIKDQKTELNKKFILCRTNIKKNICGILFVFLYMLIVNIFKYDKELCVCSCSNLFYFISHFLMLFSVLVTIIKTGKMFFCALKLNTERDYFNKELDIYIKEIVIELEKRADVLVNKKHKKEEKAFKKFLKENRIFFDDKNKMNSDSDYVEIYPIKSGIIGGYNYEKLMDLSNYINNQIITDEGYVSNKNLVFIVKHIGKKVSKKEPVFYCLKEFEIIFNSLNETVIYTDNRMYINDEIETINNGLFNLASEYKEPDAFDENNMLFNYFKYLYENKLYGIKSLALNNIEKEYRKVCNSYSENKQFAIFLNHLSNLAYSNNDYEDFEYINSIKGQLYVKQIYMSEINLKKIAFDFANNVIGFNILPLKRNSDVRYYDNMMSILLKFLVCLIKTFNYEAIRVLLENLLFERITYKDNELDKYDIVNFQFICGIIHCIILLPTNNQNKKNIDSIIQKLVYYVDKWFVNLDDAWKVIIAFKKYYGQKSCVQKAYNNLEFELNEQIYINTLTVWKTQPETILWALLYIFQIDYVDTEQIDRNNIDWRDKVFYERLLDKVDSNVFLNLKNSLNIVYDKTLIIESLNIAIKETNIKEKEFDRISELDTNKVMEFKKLIREKVNVDSDFTNKLRKYNKIKQSKSKIKKALGINQLIPRKIFFSEVFGFETIPDSYCGALDEELEKYYLKKLEVKSQESGESLENLLDKVDDIEEYIIITNCSRKRTLIKYEYDNNEETIRYKNKIIPVINAYKMEGLYLLKKSDLPTINYCEFDENEWDKKYINKSCFFEFVDCSKDESLRKKIIKESAWLEEKGDIVEQDNYLKECCRIRLYKAFKITTNRNARIIKISAFE